MFDNRIKAQVGVADSRSEQLQSLRARVDGRRVVEFAMVGMTDVTLP